MLETDPLSIETELSPEDAERLSVLTEAIDDTLENLGSLITPGDRFALQPANFEEAEGELEDFYGERLPDLMLLLAMRSLGVTKDNLAQPFRVEGANQWFHTSAEDTVLGTDGDIWWVELESGMNNRR